MHLSRYEPLAAVWCSMFQIKGTGITSVLQQEYPIGGCSRVQRQKMVVQREHKHTYRDFELMNGQQKLTEGIELYPRAYTGILQV